MTANEKLSNNFTLNQHILEKYKNEITSSLLLFFKRMEKNTQKLITTSYNEDNLLQKDKKVLLKKIKELQETELNKLYKNLIKDSEKVLGVQADFYKKQLEDVFKDFSEDIKISRVSDNQLKKDFEKSKLSFDGGEYFTIVSFWKTFEDSVRGRTIQNIESAYLYDKKRKDLTDDMNRSFKTNEGQFDSVSRTLIENAWIVAMSSMHKANLNVVSGYIWNSLIDNKTSPFCIEHAQEYFLFSAPELSTLPYEIYAPAHHRCRTTNPPITKSWQELGLDPNNLTEADKEYLNGTIPEKETYFQWFEKQKESIKKEILGKTRYNAYKNGNIKIEQFYSNGERVSISELREKGLNI